MGSYHLLVATVKGAVEIADTARRLPAIPPRDVFTAVEDFLWWADTVHASDPSVLRECYGCSPLRVALHVMHAAAADEDTFRSTYDVLWKRVAPHAAMQRAVARDPQTPACILYRLAVVASTT